MVKALISAACAAVFACLGVHAGITPDYVQNGLVCAFDGIDNQGTGTHNASAATWVDLSGYGSDATAGSPAPVWTDGKCAYSVNGSSKRAHFTFTPSAELLAAANDTVNGHTLQLCCSAASVVQSAYFLRLITGGAWGPYFHNTSFEVRYTLRNTTTAVGTTTAIKSPGTETYSFMPNTMKRTTTRRLLGTYSMAMGATDSTGGGRILSPSYDLDGKLYAVRVYNRPLSAYETAVNARVDGVRFFGSNADERVVSSLSSSTFGAEYGSPAPAYNAMDVAALGSSQDFSVAPSLSTFADGQRALTVLSGLRARYLGYTLTLKETPQTPVDGDESVAFTLADDTLVTWRWTEEYEITAKAQGTG